MQIKLVHKILGLLYQTSELGKNTNNEELILLVTESNFEKLVQTINQKPKKVYDALKFLQLKNDIDFYEETGRIKITDQGIQKFMEGVYLSQYYENIKKILVFWGLILGIITAVVGILPILRKFFEN